MSLSSNITIFWDAMTDKGLSMAEGATLDVTAGDVENLLLPQPQRTATLAGDGGAPTVTVSKSGSGRVDFDALVVSGFVPATQGADLGTVSLLEKTSGYAALNIDMSSYQGPYAGGISGLWAGQFDRGNIYISPNGSCFYDTGLHVGFQSFATSSLTLSRIMFCNKWYPTHNFDFGWKASIIDNSQTVKSIGGQSWTAKKSKQWQITFDLSAMATEEAVGELAAIAWKLGTDTDFVLALTPNADEADVFTLYGRFTKLPTFTNSKYGLYDTQLVFTESL